MTRKVLLLRGGQEVDTAGRPSAVTESRLETGLGLGLVAAFLGGAVIAFAEGLDRLAAAITEMLLVVDENRGSELLRKLKGVASSDVEHAVDDLGRVGQQAGGQRTHGYIASGAETPSSCRAI